MCKFSDNHRLYPVLKDKYADKCNLMPCLFKYVSNKKRKSTKYMFSNGYFCCLTAKATT